MNVGQFQVGDYLCAVNRKDSRNGLNFDNDTFTNNEIQSVAAIDLHVAVAYP